MQLHPLDDRCSAVLLNCSLQDESLWLNFLNSCFSGAVSGVSCLHGTTAYYKPSQLPRDEAIDEEKWTQKNWSSRDSRRFYEVSVFGWRLLGSATGIGGLGCCLFVCLFFLISDLPFRCFMLPFYLVSLWHADFSWALLLKLSSSCISCRAFLVFFFFLSYARRVRSAAFLLFWTKRRWWRRHRSTRTEANH